MFDEEKRKKTSVRRVLVRIPEGQRTLGRNSLRKEVR
jgi:hypothetical protein